MDGFKAEAATQGEVTDQRTATCEPLGKPGGFFVPRGYGSRVFWRRLGLKNINIQEKNYKYL
jgi:hypothetical protein